MFRRKEDSDSLFTNEATDQLSVESATVITPQQSASVSSFAATGSSNTPPVTPRPAQESRPAAPQSNFRPATPISSELTRNRMPEVKQSATASNASQPQNTSTNSKISKRVLTVGNDILLKGEIATCDRLVIEGKVDATLNDVHTVEIAEGGSFKGSAQIEDAEISGLFEGDLVVRNCLVIRSTGKVRGKISFGEVEIERGGELTGEVKITTAPQIGSRSTRTGAPAKQDDKVAA